jgi:ribosomal protein S27E
MCQYTERKPVGIECPDCGRKRHVYGTTSYPIAGMRNGEAIYLDWEDKK